jgi:two-component system sporulation sensor kinase A
MRRRGKGINLLNIRNALKTQQIFAQNEKTNLDGLDCSAEPVFIHNDTIILYVNAALIRLLKADGPEQLVGKAVAELESRIQQQKGKAAKAEVIRIPTVFRGEPAQLVLLKSSPPNQKKAELALKESEERYRDLVELSPAPVIVLHADYTILFVNEAAVNLLGAAADYELLGKSLLAFVDTGCSDSTARAIDRLFKEKTAPLPNTFEKKLVRVDGKLIEIEARAIPITYLGQKAVQLLCADVTDRKIVAETIRESDRRYQLLLKLSPEPVVAHDGDMLVYANDAAIKLVGARSRDDLIGQSIFGFIHPDYHEMFKERMQLVRGTDIQLNAIRIKVITLNNELIEVEGSSIYVYKHLNVPLIQTVFRDITEQKRTEEMMIRSEKLSIVGQLAAGVAHEIRNPLTTLKGFAQLLKAGKRNDAYIDLMQIELERINQIVNEFMVIAKPQNVELSKHSLFKIIMDVVQLMDMQAIINKVEIRHALEENVACICNVDQLKQVFINILKNAIEAMPNGGCIDIIMARTAEWISIRFIDEGCGIPLDVLSRLGEPFFTTKETGTGLGLMICQKIIETHNGSMQIHSEINHGTQIEILLPSV